MHAVYIRCASDAIRFYAPDSNSILADARIFGGTGLHDSVTRTIGWVSRTGNRLRLSLSLSLSLVRLWYFPSLPISLLCYVPFALGSSSFFSLLTFSPTSVYIHTGYLPSSLSSWPIAIRLSLTGPQFPFSILFNPDELAMGIVVLRLASYRINLLYSNLWQIFNISADCI